MVPQWLRLCSKYIEGQDYVWCGSGKNSTSESKGPFQGPYRGHWRTKVTLWHNKDQLVCPWIPLTWFYWFKLKNNVDTTHFLCWAYSHTSLSTFWDVCFVRFKCWPISIYLTKVGSKSCWYFKRRWFMSSLLEWKYDLNLFLNVR